MVTLRPYLVEDARAVYEAVHESLDELSRWMPWAHPDYAIDESTRWIDEQVKAFEAKSAFEFVILVDDRYAGGVGLNQIDKGNRRANLGYWVRASSSGRGVATEAVRQIYLWALENTDLFRLELVIALDNLASQRVAEKAGAMREGILRQRLNLHGVPHDAVLYSLTRTPVRIH